MYTVHTLKKKKEHTIFLDMFTTLSLISILLAYNVDEKFNNMKNVSPSVVHLIRPKKKNCYVALSRPTVKCEKTGSGFFFFFMSDLGEEFAKICIQWLKKALA